MVSRPYSKSLNHLTRASHQKDRLKIKVLSMWAGLAAPQNFICTMATTPQWKCLHEGCEVQLAMELHPQLQPGLLRLLLIILSSCLKAGTSKGHIKAPSHSGEESANPVSLFSSGFTTNTSLQAFPQGEESNLKKILGSLPWGSKETPSLQVEEKATSPNRTFLRVGGLF